MNHKFKVGDVIRWPNDTYFIRLAEIIKINNKRNKMTIRVIEYRADVKDNQIGEIYRYKNSFRTWELDTEYLARKQFDKDLEELLNENRD